MTDFVQAAILRASMDPSGYEAGAKKVETASNAVAAAADRVSASTEKVGRSTASTQQQYDRFQASVDKTYRAQQQYQSAIAKLNAFQDAGIATGARYSQTLEAIEQRYQRYVVANENAIGVTGKLKSAVEGVSSAFGEAAQFAGILGASLSVGALINFGKQVFSVAANLDEQAEQVGVSTEALQAYRAALQQNGIETGQTDALLQRLTRSMGEALSATGAQRTAFVELGLTASDLAGNTESVIPKVALGLLNIESASRRAQIETDLFGKSGQRLESALRTLADPTADLIEKEKALRQVMGTDLSNAADKAADKMAAAWNSLQISIARPTVAIANSITSIIDKLNALADASPWERIKAGFSLLGGLGWALAENDSLNDAIAGKGAAHLSLFDPTKLAGPFSQSSAQTQQFANFGFPSASSKNVFDEAAWDKYLADRKEEARLTTLSATEQAAEKEAIQQSIEKQTINGAKAEEINKTYAYAVQYLTQQELSHARSNGLLTAQVKISKDQAAQLREMEKAADSIIDKYAEQYEKQRATYDNFHAQLAEEATLAGQSADQRELSLALQKEIALATDAGLQPQRAWVTATVQARQEAEKWRGEIEGVTRNITTSCEEVPAAVLADASSEIAVELKRILA
ncbi:MAG TPA: hypothetical protein VIM56_00750 [Rhizomicrobium sp.]